MFSTHRLFDDEGEDHTDRPLGQEKVGSKGQESRSEQLHFIHPLSSGSRSLLLQLLRKPKGSRHRRFLDPRQSRFLRPFLGLFCFLFGDLRLPAQGTGVGRGGCTSKADQQSQARSSGRSAGIEKLEHDLPFRVRGEPFSPGLIIQQEKAGVNRPARGRYAQPKNQFCPSPRDRISEA